MATNYLGRWQQGQEAPYWFLCKNASGVPTDPDAVPTVDIYLANTGLIVGAKGVPILDPVPTTGFFAGFVYLNENYPAGLYTLVFRYLISGSRYSDFSTFEVVPGGDPTGQILAMTYFHQPQADYYVQQRSSGRIYRGQNPRV